MSLTAGTRLGAYEIIALLGAGGMGEVYRATDTHLGRAVAIKVLPEAFAENAERLARFEREAKTLASLNHPNIAIVQGFEKGEGVRALVMELVEGATLADRIAQGSMPVDEAVAGAPVVCVYRGSSFLTPLAPDDDVIQAHRIAARGSRVRERDQQRVDHRRRFGVHHRRK